MSDRVERRLLNLLDHPHHSPYGNPIPGLAELGETRPQEEFLTGVVPLAQLAPPNGGAGRAVVARLGEPLQVDPELLAQLADAGVKPGEEIVIERSAGGLTIGGGGASVPLDVHEDIARHIFVVAG